MQCSMYKNPHAYSLIDDTSNPKIFILINLFTRQNVQLPISSNKKRPPRSSFISVGSSSGFHARQVFDKPSFVLPPPKFDKHLETVREDEMPDFLSSPTTGIKSSSSSPNGKRVSPPHSMGSSMSPGLRSSRKLILQSIPSFPSLTPNQWTDLLLLRVSFLRRELYVRYVSLSCNVVVELVAIFSALYNSGAFISIIKLLLLIKFYTYILFQEASLCWNFDDYYYITILRK